MQSRRLFVDWMELEGETVSLLSSSEEDESKYNGEWLGGGVW